MSAKTPTIELKADVWEGLGEFLKLDVVGRQAEVAAGLFGHVQSNDRIVVEKIVPNEHLGDRESVAIDWELMAWNDTERMRLVGDAHSHPSGGMRPSEADRSAWAHAAKELEQPFACLILTAREGWEAGYLVDDWSDPVISGWVADPDGALTEARVAREPRWLSDLRADRAWSEWVATHAA